MKFRVIFFIGILFLQPLVAIDSQAALGLPYFRNTGLILSLNSRSAIVRTRYQDLEVPLAFIVEKQLRKNLEVTIRIPVNKTQMVKAKSKIHPAQ